MYSFILTILMLGSTAGSSPVSEQKPVDWSPMMDQFDQVDPVFIDRGDGGYMLVSGGDALHVSVFNSNYQESNKHDIPISLNGFEVIYGKSLNEGFALIAEYYNKETGILSAYRIQLNQDGSLAEGPTQLLSFSEAKKKQAQISLVASNDSTKWLIHPLTTGKYEQLPITILDRELNVDRKQMVILTKLDNAISRKFAVDNQGEVYGLTCLDKPKSKRQAGVPAQEFHLSVFDEKGKAITHLVELHPGYGAIEASTMSLIPRGDGKVELSGLYKGIGYPGQQVQGVFFTRMDATTGSYEVEQNWLLDHNFFRRYLPNLNFLSNIPLEKFEVKYMIEDGSGGYVMAAEYLSTRNINMPVLDLVSKAEFEVKPEAIFVLRFDGSGNMSWAHWIDRRQEYINNYDYKGFSMALGAKGVQICYTYQGNSYNVAASEIRLVTLTNDGNKYMQVIDPIDGNRVRLRPSSCMKSGKRMLLYGEQSSLYRMALVEIP
jgi:hypothetical protein